MQEEFRSLPSTCTCFRFTINLLEGRFWSRHTITMNIFGVVSQSHLRTNIGNGNQQIMMLSIRWTRSKSINIYNFEDMDGNFLTAAHILVTLLIYSFQFER